jgi:2-polyprenyl-3-methyl-5-hydroxy-6-metoxy-1,4-benzoquinol methylase
MENTIERLYYKLGDDADTKTIRHLKRYDFSASNYKDEVGEALNILDFGCGSGYGSKLFHKAFPNAKILGYDISEDAIKYASENNKAENVEFTNILENVLKNDAYDIIILCDMIEHLTDEEQTKILNDLLAHSPNATFYISTPLNNYDGQSKTNKHHINCFTKKRFENFLNNYFSSYTFYVIDWSFSRLMADRELYGGVMAVCRNV